jgi:hypothetical protein
MEKYCTGVPDRIVFSVSECCMEHDKDYSSEISKFEADKKLFKCMFNKKAYITSFIYFLGVSLFGHSYHKKAQKNKKQKNRK